MPLAAINWGLPPLIGYHRLAKSCALVTCAHVTKAPLPKQTTLQELPLESQAHTARRWDTLGRE